VKCSNVFVIIFSLLYSLNAFSNSAVATFNYETHMQTKRSYKLELKKGHVFLNGVKLNRSDIILNHSALRRIMATNTGRTPQGRCYEGKFRHVVQAKGKRRIVTGCLGDPHFREINNAFKRVVALKTWIAD
jgi:hypothetical protein